MGKLIFEVSSATQLSLNLEGELNRTGLSRLQIEAKPGGTLESYVTHDRLHRSPRGVLISKVRHRKFLNVHTASTKKVDGIKTHPIDSTCRAKRDMRDLRIENLSFIGR